MKEDQLEKVKPGQVWKLKNKILKGDKGRVLILDKVSDEHFEGVSFALSCPYTKTDYKDLIIRFELFSEEELNEWYVLTDTEKGMKKIRKWLDEKDLIILKGREEWI